MPDQPLEKRVRVSAAREPARRRAVQPGRLQYVELCCRTNHSFLEGASHPDELVLRAFELGQQALAITDVNSLGGIARAHVAAGEVGLPIVCGARLRFQDVPPVVVWVKDRVGYARLCRLLTLGRRRAEKGECHLWWDDLAKDSAGMLAGVLLHRMRDEGPADERATADAKTFLGQFVDVFGDRGYALAGLFHGPDDCRRRGWMTRWATEAGLPQLATSDVLYHVRGRQQLADVLSAIRHRRPVAELGWRRQVNAERALAAPVDVGRLFTGDRNIVERTVEVADRCKFSLDELKYEYPGELCPPGWTPATYLAELTWNGGRRRYPEGIPGKVRSLITHELALIEDLGYEPYFLTVWDLVRFARSREILCQGRGSAANSAVCFCLGITSVDPERIDVLFERFVSRERDEAPDIDIDFESERREEVLQYLYKKYGRERAGMTGVVISYRPRSALRDVGKALGLSLDRVDRLAKTVDQIGDDDRFAAGLREAGLNPMSRTGRQLVELVRAIQGFPRHLSQHVGGMVITRGRLSDLVPIENAAMQDRTVIQWDKDDLDCLGILKIDCLSLGMLSAIHRCLETIGIRRQGQTIDEALASIPSEDPAVYDMICVADTVGVFQIESRAQMSMLPRLKPRCFYDLVIEVAIVRPGPIQGDMVHPYLRRRAGQEAVSYPDEAIRNVLQKTLGVPIFQEQAMRLAVVAAGFTPGEADQLRRAMGAWRRPGVIDRFQRRLVAGMQERGYEEEFAQRVFRQIRGFGEYGFPESHAASFALLVYVSAWLKRYYPAQFTAALLNSQPMGFYSPPQLVADTAGHGVDVRPVDINFSDWDCTIEGDATCQGWPVGVQRDAETSVTGAARLRLGLRMVRGLSEAAAERIVAERRKSRFVSIDDAARRANLSDGDLGRLSRADVFGSLGSSRRESLWEALADRSSYPLWVGRDTWCGPAVEEEVVLPEMSDEEEVVADYRAQGLSLRGHPFEFLRQEVRRLGGVPAVELSQARHGRLVIVAGIVLLRQRPGTARGVTFVTLEDETGMVNLIVKQRVWDRYRRVARTARAVLAFGILQREDNVMHVLTDRLVDLSTVLADLPIQSRDFR
ncbi:MAG: error-prone DNA polymerase [Planctomycetaceae bacterium]|nr:error-prone DNA polymerase [Planctomycetaceae bacterium]